MDREVELCLLDRSTAKLEGNLTKDNNPGCSIGTWRCRGRLTSAFCACRVKRVVPHEEAEKKTRQNGMHREPQDERSPMVSFVELAQGLKTAERAHSLGAVLVGKMHIAPRGCVQYNSIGEAWKSKRKPVERLPISAQKTPTHSPGDNELNTCTGGTHRHEPIGQLQQGWRVWIPTFTPTAMHGNNSLGGARNAGLNAINIRPTEAGMDV